MQVRTPSFWRNSSGNILNARVQRTRIVYSESEIQKGEQSMKRRWQAGMVFVMATVIAVIACDGTSTPPPPPPPPADDPTPQQPDSEPAEPVGLADLALLDVSIVASSQPGYSHEVVGVVTNTGAADATGFDVGCTYVCPGGLVNSGGMSIVIGGYIAANDQFTYRSSVTIACDPVPAFLDLECSVDEDGSVPEENEGNNTGFFSVSIPQ
jgi:hypothetical protein